jgi:hypothetical protein
MCSNLGGMLWFPDLTMAAMHGFLKLNANNPGTLF